MTSPHSTNPHAYGVEITTGAVALAGPLVGVKGSSPGYNFNNNKENICVY